MAKAKQSTVVNSEALSTDDQKQFEAMKTADKEPDDANIEAKPAVEPPAQDSKSAAEANKSADTQPSGETGKDVVPLATLLEERTARKAAEKATQDQAIENARLAERVNLINQAIEANQRQPQKPQKVEVPDPEKDALGALKAITHNNKLTEEENKILQDFRQKTERETQSRNYINEIASFAKQQEDEFVKTNPDYQEATGYLMNSRLQELMLYGATEQQARQQIASEIINIGETAKKTNKNAAEMLYKFAGARGYQKKAATAQVPTETEKLAAIEAGQRANRSLGDLAGGASPSTAKIDAKTLATMSEAQFAKTLAALSVEDRMSMLGN